MSNPEAAREVGDAIKSFLAARGWPNMSHEQIISMLLDIWKHLDSLGLIQKYNLNYQQMCRRAQTQYMLSQHPYL